MACQRCGKCCRDYCVAMSRNEDTARFLTYHGLNLRSRGDGLMEVYGQSKCVNLRTSKEHGTSCACYKTRPAICQNFLCERAKS
jgi:Fe-S-cluster containining protein